jgi:hypothetical protein
MQNPLSYLNSLGNNEDDSGDEDAGDSDRQSRAGKILINA